MDGWMPLFIYLNLQSLERESQGDFTFYPCDLPPEPANQWLLASIILKLYIEIEKYDYIERCNDLWMRVCRLQSP